ncbi:hypothetical protein SNE40_004777 [Patella caerulea]|uniref:Uncharacterized protein n=1 Tax=Patella caerulea TaxID=87958 RepID=A0AAN8QCT8_PATCE
MPSSRKNTEDQAFWYDDCYGDFVASSTCIISRNWLKSKKRATMKRTASCTSSINISGFVLPDDDKEYNSDVNCDNNDDGDTVSFRSDQYPY